MGIPAKYVDLDFNFTLNPITEDVAKKKDDNAIKQSLKNLIIMRQFDVPFHPEISSQVSESLFENFNSMTASVIKRAIVYTITNFEPRVQLSDVIITDDVERNIINIVINYTIIATGQQSTYSFNVNRTR